LILNKSKFKIKLILFAMPVFIVLNIIFMGGVVYYSYTQNGLLTYHYKAQSFANTANRLRAQTDIILKPVLDLTKRADQLAWSPLGDPLPHEALENLAQLMAANPQISSVYFATADDAFIQISTIREGTLFDRGKLAPPVGAAFAIRRMEGPHNLPRIERWSFLDNNNEIMGDPIQRTNIYNPLLRPWYEAAITSPGTVISEPYPFLSVNSVGITASRHVERWGGGVLGVDLTLETLSDALTQLEMPDDSIALVLTDKGDLVAADKMPQLIGTPSAETKTTIQDINAPLAEALFSLAMGTTTVPDAGSSPNDRWVEFQVGGQEYSGQVVPLLKNFSRPTFLGFAINRDEFLTDVNHILANSLAVSMLFLLLSIAVTALVVKTLTRPIASLAEETKRIRRFDLTEIGRISSHITELDELGRSLGAMKVSLAAFRRYIPEVIVRRMVQDGKPPELGGEQHEVTIMFTDVANFTSLSELMSPKDLMRKLSSYLDCLSQQIRAEHGVVDKFIGDAVMAVWNGFDDEPAHAERACMAALKCGVANDTLNTLWRGFGWPEMHTRIGVHMGEAVVGNIGSADRMEHTTIGDTVNMAARLEGLNKIYGSRILVSETVHARVADEFLMRPVDRVIPKGSSKPMIVYELLGTLDGHDEIAASAMDKKRCAEWREVYEMFRTQDWSRMLSQLQPYLRAYPDDPVAKVYMNIAQEKLAITP